MDRFEEAWESLQAVLAEHADLVSLGMLAFAVEREVLTMPEAERLARTRNLDDFQAMGGELTLLLEAQGRREELVDVMVEGRRVLKRAQTLLRACGG